jgi:hypothetical protein
LEGFVGPHQLPRGGVVGQVPVRVSP